MEGGAGNIYSVLYYSSITQYHVQWICTMEYESYNLFQNKYPPVDILTHSLTVLDKTPPKNGLNFKGGPATTISENATILFSLPYAAGIFAVWKLSLLKSQSMNAW